MLLKEISDMHNTIHLRDLQTASSGYALYAYRCTTGVFYSTVKTHTL